MTWIGLTNADIPRNKNASFVFAWIGDNYHFKERERDSFWNMTTSKKQTVQISNPRLPLRYDLVDDGIWL